MRQCVRKVILTAVASNAQGSGTFARIRAAITGTKGKFEQERFCPSSGTWQQKSCGNLNHERIRHFVRFYEHFAIESMEPLRQ